MINLRSTLCLTLLLFAFIAAPALAQDFDEDECDGEYEDECDDYDDDDDDDVSEEFEALESLDVDSLSDAEALELCEALEDFDDDNLETLAGDDLDRLRDLLLRCRELEEELPQTEQRIDRDSSRDDDDDDDGDSSGFDFEPDDLDGNFEGSDDIDYVDDGVF